MSADYAVWIDRLATTYCAGAYVDEVARGRREYAELSGRPINEDASPDALESELQAFLHWYILERKLSDKTPLQHFLGEDNLEEEDRAILFALHASHRSIFSIEQLQPEPLFRDFLLNGLWRIGPGECYGWPDSTRESLVETTLVATNEGHMVLLGHPVFYSREAREAILTLCAHGRAQHRPRPDILWDLRRRQTKAERYQHLPAWRFFGS